MDAIDTALVQFEPGHPRLSAYHQFPIDDAVRMAVRNLSTRSTIAEIGKYDIILGNLFANAVTDFLARLDIEYTEVSAIGSHGQTILHLPDADTRCSLQIGDANIIAYRTGITTVADFRRMDIAAGGQGAPLAPAFHEFLFHSTDTDRVILNIGGIANITVLAADKKRETIGFDSGPGNGLLDDWNRLHKGTAMDENSNWANSGKVDMELLGRCLDDPYFYRPPPKSTGRDYFNLDWLESFISRLGKKLPPQDIQATLLQLSLQNIVSAIDRYAASAAEIYVCGGGGRNASMMHGLQKLLPAVAVSTTDALGYNPDAIEAMTFAWLAKQRLEHRPGNLPAVTGAEQPVQLGAIYASG